MSSTEIRDLRRDAFWSNSTQVAFVECGKKMFSKKILLRLTNHKKLLSKEEKNDKNKD